MHTCYKRYIQLHVKQYNYDYYEYIITSYNYCSSHYTQGSVSETISWKAINMYCRLQFISLADLITNGGLARCLSNATIVQYGVILMSLNIIIAVPVMMTFVNNWEAECVSSDIDGNYCEGSFPVAMKMFALLFCEKTI